MGRSRDQIEMSEVLLNPSFVIIGAQRAGTRWLRANLADHPDIFLPPRPLDYFVSGGGGGRGRRGYRLLFRGAGDASVLGEASPSYLLPRSGPREIAARLDAAVDDLRLVAIVREPVDRMFSAMRDHIIRGRLPQDADLFDMIRRSDPEVDRLDLVGGGLYTENLYPYHKRFGARLLIVVHDDIRDDPAAVYERVLRHIGAAPGFVPSRLDRLLYSNAESRWGPRTEVTPEQQRILYMLFRRDVEELEAMIGRTLPAWDPGPPPIDWADRIPVPT